VAFVKVWEKRKKAPSTNIQAPEKLQFSKTNAVDFERSLDIEV
jgi:hypothetical protein